MGNPEVTFHQSTKHFLALEGGSGIALGKDIASNTRIGLGVTNRTKVTSEPYARENYSELYTSFILGTSLRADSENVDVLNDVRGYIHLPISLGTFVSPYFGGTLRTSDLGNPHADVVDICAGVRVGGFMPLGGGFVLPTFLDVGLENSIQTATNHAPMLIISLAFYGHIRAN